MFAFLEPLRGNRPKTMDYVQKLATVCPSEGMNGRQLQIG